MQAALAISLLTILALAGTSSARAVELLGISVGSSASAIGECQSKEIVRGIRRYVDSDPATGRWIPGPCLEHFGSEIGSGQFADDDVLVARPLNRPTFLKSREPVRVTLRGGIVHEFVVKTRGVSVQEQVAEALIAKLGAPDEQSVVDKSNALGATFPVVRMSWKLESGAVSFSGALSTFDEGIVTVMSPVAAQERDARIEEMLKANTF